MALFEPALRATLANEDSQLSGVVTPDPSASHPDAKARFGLNSGANPDAVTAGFYEMEREAALEFASNIYKYRYFSPMLLYSVNDQAIANKLFDLAVNCGCQQATKIVQRAVNSLMLPNEIGLPVDGAMGVKTLDAINRLWAGDVLTKIRTYAVMFYQDLARQKKVAGKPWPETTVKALIARAGR